MEEQYYDEVEYAGFWLRVAAYLIDGIILNIALYILFAIFGISAFSGMMGSEMLETGEPNPEAVAAMFSSFSILMLISVVGSWLYFALQESSDAQATLGKRAVRIRVTDFEGDKITFARATGRYFGKIISGMIFMIGYFMAGFTERKQALHDMMASTLVLRDD
ncbi:MAG: RDD family protein [Saprospiraceae bacterium]|nr:RDD family protein [Saprospiraceae bacterium]